MRIVCVLLCFFSTFSFANEPVRLIYDTDLGNDIDDALALFLIHELQDRGEVELLGMGISKADEWAAVYTDAINTFYGRIENRKKPEEYKFNRQVSDRKIGDKFVYPHDVRPETVLPTATQMYRKILAEKPGKSVLISVMGFTTNLAHLLESKPDEFSELNGVDLVQKKLSC